VDEYLELREVPTRPETAAGLHLKGWLTEAERNAIGALWGYGPEQMEHLYLNRGRPATTRQVHIGWQRGGRLEGASSEREAHMMAVEQSSIRPEYEPLLWAQRYTNPSAFVIRALAQDGTFDAATTERILIESGWNPEYAELASGKWAGDEETGPPTKWLDRARSRLFTALHNDYMDGSADEATARAGLARLGAVAAEIGPIIGLWNYERDETLRDLTQAQILKLYKSTVWTREMAQARLEDLGMLPSEASNLLDADAPA